MDDFFDFMLVSGNLDRITEKDPWKKPPSPKPGDRPADHPKDKSK